MAYQKYIDQVKERYNSKNSHKSVAEKSRSNENDSEIDDIDEQEIPVTRQAIMEDIVLSA